MTATRSRGPWTLILIALICVLPIALAWMLKENPRWLQGRMNYGRLIEPAKPLDRQRFFRGADNASAAMREISGRWVLLQITRGCGPACETALYKTKQIRLMLDKDLLRVRRLLVFSAGAPGKRAAALRGRDPHLLLGRCDEALLDEFSVATGELLREGTVWLLDPLGNLMMWYPPGFDPYGVKADLKRLLQVSQIG